MSSFLSALSKPARAAFFAAAALAALCVLGSFWANSLARAIAPVQAAARQSAAQERALALCQTSAPIGPAPSEPDALEQGRLAVSQALSAARCFLDRTASLPSVSPAPAAIALNALWSAAARSAVLNENPQALRDTARALHAKASPQARAEALAMARADQRVQTLCQTPLSSLCALAGVNADERWAEGARDLQERLEIAFWKTLNPEAEMLWLSRPPSEAGQTDPAIMSARAVLSARAPAAR